MKTAKPKQLLVTHADAAVMVGVSNLKLLRMAKSGRGDFPAPVRLVDRTYYFKRADVERWCDGRRPSL